MYRYNTGGQNLGFNLLSAATGADLTGATVAVLRVVDGGSQAAATGTVTEKGGGQYNFAPSAADLAGSQISFLFKASGAVTVEKTVVTTQANPQDGVRLGLSALPNAAAGASGGLLVTTVWTDALAGNLAGDYGAGVAGAARQALVNAFWDELKSGHTVPGSFGAYLDAAISSRLATLGYTAPPAASAIRQEIDANSTKLDATIGSRAPASTALTNLTWTDTLAGNLAGDYAAGAAQAARDALVLAIWTYAARTLTSGGSGGGGSVDVGSIAGSVPAAEAVRDQSLAPVADALAAIVGALLDANVAGEPLRKSLRRMVAAMAGPVDLTTAPGFAIFRFPGTSTEAFRCNLTRTTITDGSAL